MGYNSEQRKHFSFGPLDFSLCNLTLENWFFFSNFFFLYFLKLTLSIFVLLRFPFLFILCLNALCITHLIRPKKKRNSCYYCYRVLAAACVTATGAADAIAVLHWYYHLFYVPKCDFLCTKLDSTMRCNQSVVVIHTHTERKTTRWDRHWE